MKRATLKRLAVKVNDLTSRAGFNLVPVSYYSEVPDRRWLRDHQDLWARPMVPIGQEWDLSDQLSWLRSTCAPYLGEVAGFNRYNDITGFSTSFGPVASQVLHGVVRSYAPARIVEIGSGVSTAIQKHASDRNGEEGRQQSDITCVDPYPSAALRDLGVRVLPVAAQGAPLDLFAGLGKGDLLFIDSTHAVHTGSEVIRLYLEIVPQLAAGVLIHIHDIYLPYLFSPNLFNEVVDPQETVLVAALLTCNSRLKILGCLSAMAHERPEKLREVLPDFRPRRMVNGIYASTDGHFPSSLWLEVT